MRASAAEIQSSGVMLSLLNSFGMLWPAYGPVDGSEKQPREAKPKTAEMVELVAVLLNVVVIIVVVGRSVDEEDEELVLVGLIELKLELESALRLLYMESRDEPPHYTK